MPPNLQHRRIDFLCLCVLFCVCPLVRVDRTPHPAQPCRVVHDPAPSPQMQPTDAVDSCSTTSSVFSQNPSHGAAWTTARTCIFFFSPPAGSANRMLGRWDAGMLGCCPAPLLIRARCRAASPHPASSPCPIMVATHTRLVGQLR